MIEQDRTEDLAEIFDPYSRDTQISNEKARIILNKIFPFREDLTQEKKDQILEYIEQASQNEITGIFNRGIADIIINEILENLSEKNKSLGDGVDIMSVHAPKNPGNDFSKPQNYETVSRGAYRRGGYYTYNSDPK